MTFYGMKRVPLWITISHTPPSPVAQLCPLVPSCAVVAYYMQDCLSALLCVLRNHGHHYTTGNNATYSGYRVPIVRHSMSTTAERMFGIHRVCKTVTPCNGVPMRASVPAAGKPRSQLQSMAPLIAPSGLSTQSKAREVWDDNANAQLQIWLPAHTANVVYGINIRCIHRH